MLGQLYVKAVVGVVPLAELAEIAGRGKFCRMGGGQGSTPGYGFFLSILNLLLELEALEAEVFIAEDLVGAGGYLVTGEEEGRREVEAVVVEAGSDGVGVAEAGWGEGYCCGG